MPIILKSRHEINMMRRAGQLACELLARLRQATRPGVTTQQLEKLAADELARVGARGLSLYYPTYRRGEGFPSPICLSVNEEVVHGIAGKRVLKEGDIITLDMALEFNGFCCDTATTVPVGKVSAPIQKLLDVTKETLALAIANMRPGKRWSDIARLMQHHVEQNGFSVVREFVGHGIGRTMHEDPKVPNFVNFEQIRGDFELRKGMTLAVEPMVVMGKRDVDLLPDGWTVVTADKLPAAHFEHTVAVTEGGVEILTDGRGPEVATATGT